MLDKVFRRQEVRRRIRNNPLGLMLERYVEYPAGPLMRFLVGL